jgi:transposase
MIINRGFIGIDVAKHHLDVFEGGSGRTERLANTKESLAPLVARWRASGVFVLFEATGYYDLRLRRALTAADIAFARVNPARARDFARAAGVLAKTDTIDARMLAAMAQYLSPARAAESDGDREVLAFAHKRRDQLVQQRQQERTRRSECPQPRSLWTLRRIWNGSMRGLRSGMRRSAVCSLSPSSSIKPPGCSAPFPV